MEAKYSNIPIDVNLRQAKTNDDLDSFNYNALDTSSKFEVSRNRNECKLFENIQKLIPQFRKILYVK